MNKTKIEWVQGPNGEPGYTWNPVTGCLHNCPYCYAAKIANRFGTCESNSDYVPESVKEILTKDHGVIVELDERLPGEPYPYDFAPTFHRYRLDEPARKTKGQKIFVCSMADLFGEWVPDKWIKQVLDACAAAPQHQYLFLTKNPARYYRLINLLPEIYGTGKLALWWGTTATTAAEAAERTEIMYTAGAGVANMFLSVEPMHEDLAGFINYEAIKWLIIGAETGNRKNKIIPKREWVESIVEYSQSAGTSVFMKNSLMALMGDDFIQEWPEGLR